MFVVRGARYDGEEGVVGDVTVYFFEGGQLKRTVSSEFDWSSANEP